MNHTHRDHFNAISNSVWYFLKEIFYQIYYGLVRTIIQPVMKVAPPFEQLCSVVSENNFKGHTLNFLIFKQFALLFGQ